MKKLWLVVSFALNPNHWTRNASIIIPYLLLGDSSIKSFTATSNRNDHQICPHRRHHHKDLHHQFASCNTFKRKDILERHDSTCAYPTPRRTPGTRIGARGSSSTAPRTGRSGHLYQSRRSFRRWAIDFFLACLVRSPKKPRRGYPIVGAIPHEVESGPSSLPNNYCLVYCSNVLMVKVDWPYKYDIFLITNLLFCIVEICYCGS